MPNYVEDHGLGQLKGDVPVVKALRSVLSCRTIIMVEEWKRLDHKWRSNECLKMETRMEFSHQRRVAKWAGEGDVWVQEWSLHLAMRNDVILPCRGRDRARNIYRSNKAHSTNNQGSRNRWPLTLREKASESCRKSGSTARRWWSGSMARQVKGRREVLRRMSKNGNVAEGQEHQFSKKVDPRRFLVLRFLLAMEKFFCADTFEQ